MERRGRLRILAAAVLALLVLLPGALPAGAAVQRLRFSRSAETVGLHSVNQLTLAQIPRGYSRRSLVWKSSRPDIAYVTRQGVLYGKRAGKATVTVRTGNGRYRARLSVRVNDYYAARLLPVDVGKKPARTKKTTPAVQIPEGAAVYNSLLYRLWKNNTVVVYQFSSMRRIGQFSAVTGHGNNVQFDTAKTGRGSSFVYAYINAWTNPTKLYYVKLSKSGAKPVRTVILPTSASGYYGEQVLDSDHQILYSIGYTQKSWRKQLSGERMVVSKWNLKTLKKNRDGTYTPRRITSWTVPFIPTLQGSAYRKGKLYILSSTPNVYQTKLYVLDTASKKVSFTYRKFPDAIRNSEAEQVFFYKDKLYLANWNHIWQLNLNLD